MTKSAGGPDAGTNNSGTHNAWDQSAVDPHAEKHNARSHFTGTAHSGHPAKNHSQAGDMRSCIPVLPTVRLGRAPAHTWLIAAHTWLITAMISGIMCFSFTAGAQAQAQDSHAPQSEWVEITEDFELPEGIRLFNNDARKAWYLELDMSNEEYILHPYISSSQGLPSFSREVGSIAAINGGYFSGSTSLSTIVYPGGDIKSQNPTVLSRTVDGVSRNYHISRGHFGVNTDRSMTVDWIYHFGATIDDLYRLDQAIPNERGTPAPAPNRDDGSPFEDLLVGIGGGPVLIKDGEINITFTEELIWGGVGEFNERRARTAVCYTEDDRALLFVANESPGMAFDVLADVLFDLGCHEALNLDGGGSTHMTVGDQLVNYQFVNRPIPTILAIVPADSLKLPVELIEEVILDTEMDEVTVTDGWFETANPGFYGESPSLVVPAGDGSETVTYLPDLEPGHEYTVAGWWVASFNRTKNTPYIVHHLNGVDTVRVDQSTDGSRWVDIGTWYFSGTETDKVIISNDASGTASPSFAVADAVRFGMTGNSIDPTSSGDSYPGQHDGDVPEQIRLGQNYPNPFNPVTVIPFALPEAAHVRISVYDLLGRRVATAADQPFSSGSHQVSFDATALPSGVYLYELTAGTTRLHNRMLLVK